MSVIENGALDEFTSPPNPLSFRAFSFPGEGEFLLQCFRVEPAATGVKGKPCFFAAAKNVRTIRSGSLGPICL